MDSFEAAAKLMSTVWHRDDAGHKSSVGYFVMQHQQPQMTQAEGVSFVDEQWASGQVVAMVVFALVLVEAWSAVVRVRRQAVETAS